MKKRIICMIPARYGSKRVERKNLRLINGKPLIGYAITTAKESGVFDAIWLNSEHDVFGSIADEYGISFYRRNPQLASDTANNEDFLTDFISNTEGDILVQFLPTSPLITPEEVKSFVSMLVGQDYETLISVNARQIACLYKDKEVNFSKMEQHKSSQSMTPVLSYATVLMGYTYESYLRHMSKSGCAYHGANGRTGYFEVKGLSTIDIDEESDFALAEVALTCRAAAIRHGPEYYTPEKSSDATHVEVDVPLILKRDRVMNSDFLHENMPKVNLDLIIAEQDNSSSWCRRIVNTESNSATLISQLPGEGNRLHYHPDWNEWWYIVGGQWQWEIEGKKKVVSKGDVVFIEKGRRHRITAIGGQPAVRLAVSRQDVAHVYPEEI